MKARGSHASGIIVRLAPPLLLLLGVVAVRLTIGAQPSSQSPAPIYVDAAVSGGVGDGSSWANATPSLDYAIASAATGGTIWCAMGTYTPASATDGFLITKRLKLYGGFLGPHAGYTGESQLSERRGRAVDTILNGEILTSSHTDNVNHVIKIESVDGAGDEPGVVIDGFRIKDGHGGSVLGLDGAGIWCHCSDLDVTNVHFDHNYAKDGGAIWFVSGCAGLPPPGDPTPIRNILRIKSCEFFENHADEEGGAVYGDMLWGWAINNEFVMNRAAHGGAAYIKRVNHDNRFDFTNSVFWENYCPGGTSLGGALYFDDASSALDDFAVSQVVNCTLSGNHTALCVAGQAMFVSAYSVVEVYHSILFWNTDLESYGCGTQYPHPIDGTPTVAYSDIEQGFGGQFVQNVDPMFMDGGPPLTTFLPGGVPPASAFIRDLTLKRAGTTQAGSECIDFGDYAKIPTDFADLDEDGDFAEKLPVDLIEAPRRVDRHGQGEDTPTGVDYIDQGCYERP
jgi:hypothetical protein